MGVKKVYVGWGQLEGSVSKLVSNIKEVDYVVGIPRGGLIIAVMIYGHMLNA